MLPQGPKPSFDSTIRIHTYYEIGSNISNQTSFGRSGNLNVKTKTSDRSGTCIIILVTLKQIIMSRQTYFPAFISYLVR